MKKLNLLTILTLFICLFAVAPVSAQESDAEGSKDHPLFSRMPDFYIQRYTEKKFESHSFFEKSNKETKVEGRFFHIMYYKQPDAQEPSRAEILRNYENALVKIGGKVTVSDLDGSSYLKLEKDGKEIWVHVDAYITSQYSLYIVEKAGMLQSVTANADVFAKDIKNTGHAAVYGIYFDSGKSVIKPESEAALAEIAKLLKKESGMAVYIVGHTDNTGSMDTNIKLSQARAEAVVQALVSKYGIAAARLRGHGVSSLAPVASNDTEEGKAKNRRVELVKQ